MVDRVVTFISRLYRIRKECVEPFLCRGTIYYPFKFPCKLQITQTLQVLEIMEALALSIAFKTAISYQCLLSLKYF